MLSFFLQLSCWCSVSLSALRSSSQSNDQQVSQLLRGIEFYRSRLGVQFEIMQGQSLLKVAFIMVFLSTDCTLVSELLNSFRFSFACHLSLYWFCLFSTAIFFSDHGGWDQPISRLDSLVFFSSHLFPLDLDSFHSLSVSAWVYPISPSTPYIGCAAQSVQWLFLGLLSFGSALFWCSLYCFFVCCCSSFKWFDTPSS